MFTSEHWCSIFALTQYWALELFSINITYHTKHILKSNSNSNGKKNIPYSFEMQTIGNHSRVQKSNYENVLWKKCHCHNLPQVPNHDYIVSLEYILVSVNLQLHSVTNSTVPQINYQAARTAASPYKQAINRWKTNCTASTYQTKNYKNMCEWFRRVSLWVKLNAKINTSFNPLQIATRTKTKLSLTNCKSFDSTNCDLHED